MTYEQWIAKTKNILLQYEEGAIAANETFNAVVFYAADVEQETEQADVVEVDAETLDDIMSGKIQMP